MIEGKIMVNTTAESTNVSLILVFVFSASLRSKALSCSICTTIERTRRHHAYMQASLITDILTRQLLLWHRSFPDRPLLSGIARKARKLTLLWVPVRFRGPLLSELYGI